MEQLFGFACLIIAAILGVLSFSALIFRKEILSSSLAKEFSEYSTVDLLTLRTDVRSGIFVTDITEDGQPIFGELVRHRENPDGE